MYNHKLMGVNGLYASINTPEALKGEEVHQLPPYCPCNAYVVDEYENCPDNWMHGSDKASSYFVPVEPNRGLWFDFTANDLHSHHVAVVVSVQGINPVTGQKTSCLNLEQYKGKCPIHEKNFEYNRFCPDCGYEWPAQSYLATTTRQVLWIDGFRGENGKVRQYIITEEEIRGIAAQMIGDERVFAIGFAFYLSKNPKPQPEMAKFIKIPLNEGALPWFSPSGYHGIPSAINCNLPPIVNTKGMSAGLTLTGFPPSNSISPSCHIPQDQLDQMKQQIIAQNPQCLGVNTPADDEHSLMQLASGDANIDIFYSTQVDG